MAPWRVRPIRLVFVRRDHESARVNLRKWSGCPNHDLSVPSLRLSDATVTVDAGEIMSLAANFRLRLAMIGGRIAIRVVAAGESPDTFLDEL